MTPGDRLAGHVIVVADGDLPDRAALDAAWPGWDAGVVAVVAADGGLAGARRLGLAPSVLVGDLDSLDPAEAAAAADTGIDVVQAASDKDESDTELAVLEALRRGASRITVLGALGGPRLDHALANVWLLAHPAVQAGGTTVELLDGRTRVTLLAAPAADGTPVTRHLPGPTGSVVSLFPIGGDATGITTRGLRYRLRDEALVIGPARGLSNVRDGKDASVTVVRGMLLVVESAPSSAGLSSGA